MSHVDMSSISREYQREIGALKASTDRARQHNDSTVPLTIHAAADLIEWLTIVGGDVFRDYTAKERRRMATEGRAMPDGSYPIATCTDAENAIRAQGRAKASDRAKVRAHIVKRVTALRCTGDIFDPYR